MEFGKKQALIMDTRTRCYLHNGMELNIDDNITSCFPKLMICDLAKCFEVHLTVKPKQTSANQSETNIKRKLFNLNWMA